MWEELEKTLRSIWDNPDFILGAKVFIKTDEQRAELLDAIHRGWATTPEEIVQYAMAIYHDVPFVDEE